MYDKFRWFFRYVFMQQIILTKVHQVLAFAALLAVFGLTACAAPKRIYLTYDDGPDARFTQPLLDVLQKHGVKATIFVTGENAEKHPDIVRKAFDAGHTIGNHSYSHRHAEEMSYVEIVQSYERTDKIIRSITGQKEILFRAPYLGISTDSRAYLCKMGRNSVAVERGGRDWETQDPEKIIDNILHKELPEAQKTGLDAVVLLHDSGQGDFGTRQGTVDATDMFIPMMRAKGYVFADGPPAHAWQLSEEDCTDSK